MTFDWVSLKDINNAAPESAEQDQTARMCSQILIYTLCKNISLVANGKTVV